MTQLHRHTRGLARTSSALATMIATVVVVGNAQAQAAHPHFPHPGPYTQDYATAWFTEDIDSSTKLFQYAVINLGTVGYQDATVQIGPGTSEHHWRTDTPMLSSYEIPILTPFALNSIKQDTIFAPEGWSWRLIDPSQTPGAWTNTTGDARFDNPYRLLQWYADPYSVAWQPHDTYSGLIEQHAIAPTTWLDRSSLAEAMGNPDAHAKFGGTGCGLMLWNEGCAGKGFGFEAEAGKVLGPDEVDWILVTRTGSDLIVETRPPQIGDPDLPVGRNGLSFQGGLALIAPTAAVPEPTSTALLLAGLLMFGMRHRRRMH